MGEILTQVIVCGLSFETLDDDEIIEYLQREVGKIKRYRRKQRFMLLGRDVRSFRIRDSDVRPSDLYLVSALGPAYVHFESAESTSRALRKGVARRLKIRDVTLTASLCYYGREAEMERPAYPLVFDGVAAVEIGNLHRDGRFDLVWRESNNPSIDFVIDSYRRTCYLQFPRDAAFSGPRLKKRVIIRCEVKIEFSMEQVYKVKVLPQKSSSSSSSHLLVFLLTEPAALYYRTADGKIWSKPGAECLDDYDLWKPAGSKDFRSSGVVRRCRCYRMFMPPSYTSKLLQILPRRQSQ